MAIIALMGPPGVGKSQMALTCLKKPLHVMDIDRKIRAMATYRTAVEKGEVSFKEIGETISEDGLSRRLKALVENKKGDRPPRGWNNFANYCETADKDAQFLKAGTICLDSATQLAPHLRAHIQFETGKGKFIWDAWSVWKALWQETLTILIDYCLSTATDGCKLDINKRQLACEHGCPEKDLIVIFHERVSEKPSEGTTQVRVTPSGEGGRTREYQGLMDVLICASIDGAFGLEFGTYFTDVYALRVDVDKNGTPEWVCRVHPDGQRDLRCSWPVKHHEFEPNFLRIKNDVPPPKKENAK